MANEEEFENTETPNVFLICYFHIYNLIIKIKAKYKSLKKKQILKKNSRKN